MKERVYIMEQETIGINCWAGRWDRDVENNAFSMVGTYPEEVRDNRGRTKDSVRFRMKWDDDLNDYRKVMITDI